MTDDPSICVLLPTLNEEATVGVVVEDFRDEGFENILVIDGGSSDNTQELAEAAGARVVTQSGSGKGQAIAEAVSEYIEAEIILMADADATYRASDAHAMLEPLQKGADHVIGNRFAKMHPDAMSRLNKFGNSVINSTFSYIHGQQLLDILSGYRAFTRSSFLAINPNRSGFGIETELAVECIRHGQRVEVVPIHYDPRPSGSATNLRPFRDGSVIFLTLYRLTRTNNPLFFFGSLGFLSTIVGTLVATFVGYRWFWEGVSHEVLAVVGGFGIIFGVQLLMFGLLSDLIVKLHREQMRRLDERD